MRSTPLSKPATPTISGLKIVASTPKGSRNEPAQVDEAPRDGRRGKTSTLVLVSTTAGSAMAEAAGQPEGALLMPVRPTPKAESGRRTGGGGGNGGGAGRPPRDRILNQDDLMGVLIVLALLLLLALYLIRGIGVATNEVVLNPQLAPSEPLAAPAAALLDPFGDKAVDLTPNSPPPAATTTSPAPKAIDVRLQAYFCTASSQLTPSAIAALEKRLAEHSGDLEGRDLVVEGFADTRGSSDYNLALGKARAETVADFLRARKFTNVDMAGVGELDGLADNENCPNQRRVDIRVADGPSPPPSRSCAPPQEMAELACG